MPDLYLSKNEKVRLVTRYSYASQLDTKHARLTVKLNGKPIAQAKLENPKGATQAELVTDIPAPDFYTFNDLDYQFELYPDKVAPCRFTTDAHLWGTIHATSTMDVPATIQAALPDVGYLNDAGFPFTLAPDLSQLTVVVPNTPTAAEADTLLQLMVRLGRIAPGLVSKRPTVVTLSQWQAGPARQNHLIVIGYRTLSQLSPRFQSKYQRVIANQLGNLTDTEQPLKRIAHNPAQGVIEEILSPLNHDRVALLLYGETETGQREVARALRDDDVFAKVAPGNLVVVAQGQPTSVIALKKGEAKNLSQPHGNAPNDGLPPWAGWVLLGGAGLVIIALLIRLARPGR